jgi:hypothetical protein
MGIINSFLSIFGMQPSVDMGEVLSRGFVGEHPNVTKLREEAKAKMDNWGRRTLLQDGEFTRKLTVLRERQASMF